MKNERSNWRTLLHRWISGEADRSDERALDALAQDDPFLADALEGYRSLPGADHARSVTKLKARLRKRKEEKRRGAVFFLKRIAAVGAVLLGAWLAFRSLGPDRLQSLAFDQMQETAAAKQPADTAQGSDHSTGMFSQNETKVSGQGAAGISEEMESTARHFSKKAAPAKPATTPPRPAEKSAQTPADVLPESDLAMAPTVQTAPAAAPVADGPKPDEAFFKAEEKSGASQPGAPARAADATMAQKKERPDQAPYTLKGRVMDANGDPLIGANVLVKGTPQGTITDVDGTFSIIIPVQNPTLVFDYIGYEKLEMQPVPGVYLEITMMESHQSLAEVAVTGKSAKSKKKATDRSRALADEQATAPKGGLKKFEKYIKQNLRMPAAAKAAGISGEVEIGFVLDGQGRPTDFEVVRSLGHGCDEEAVRLLREGPAWNGQIGKRHMYVFVFE